MPHIEFKLTTDHIALCDLLKLTGLADSGGRSKALIAEGLVRVNGQVDTRKTAKIRAGQQVEFGGTTIHIQGQ